MNRRNLLNLALLAVIGVLVMLVVYEPGIEAPPEPPSLLQLDRAAIDHITIQRDGQQDVELVRKEGDKWWMERPVHHAAEPLRISSLLRIATIKSLSSFAAAPDRLADFGLEQPRVTLTLNNRTTIAFGSSTPLDQRRYVMVGKRIHLITDTLYYHLIGSFPTFLRKQLLDEGVSIEKLQLPELELAWQGERWQLTPAPDDYSADRVTALLDNWRLASALEIKPYDGKPGERVTIHIAGVEQPLVLLLTSREPDLVLARPELKIQYHLDASSAAKLLQLPSLEETVSEINEEMDASEKPILDQ